MSGEEGETTEQKRRYTFKVNQDTTVGSWLGLGIELFDVEIDGEKADLVLDLTSIGGTTKVLIELLASEDEEDEEDEEVD
jgi:hypothetical protein